MPDQMAMTLDCPRCVKTIEFSGERPSFCPFCGINLSSVSRIQLTEQTASYVPISTDFTIDYDNENHRPGQDGIPAAIGGFRLTKLLGAGGMGAVYEGISDDSGQRVAVKLLTAMAKASSGSLDRFRQEGRLASQLSHPNCVFVLNADEEGGRPYIVMELMPGATLREYVQEHGPLSADEAMTKILDVIDGLIEAHKLNILHRDVKPSNCFLMADGRVKIGDFGLSKSLSVDGNLTQTGSFLGTVLYAAPEQIKGETLDFTADVYSVCATLYFLLTGQAPFQHESPTAVISRVITESPPDIRLRRPDLPRALQKTVMRGLDRQPDKRFQSLDELRTALHELVCRPITRSSLGSRLVASVMDAIALIPVWISLAVAESWFNFGDWLSFFAPAFVYFAVTEFAFGCTLGKWVLRLRVRDVDGRLPSFRHILVRTAVFVVLTLGAGLAADNMFDLHHKRMAALGIGAFVLGCGAIVSTMRARSGYRGLHEWASGTRVVQMPWPRKVRRILPRDEWTPELEPLTTEPGLPSSFGGFQPAGIMERYHKTLRLHLCDSMLRRDVLLIVRPDGEHPVSEQRKSLARPARTRWLAGGVTDGWSWDAFLAPAGTPLPAIVADHQRLAWPETQGILEQLSDELSAAAADGTMARPLRPEHVFVRPDGQLQLLDSLGDQPITDEDAFALIRQVGPIALEGDANWQSRRPKPLAAVLPLHARKTLNGLCAQAPKYKTVSEFRTALEDIEPLPNEAATPQRIISLAMQGILTGIPMVVLLISVGLFGLINLEVAHISKVTWHTLKNRITENTAEVVCECPKLEDPIRLQFVTQLVSDMATTSDRSFENAAIGLNAVDRLGARFVEQTFSGEQIEAESKRIFDILIENIEDRPSEPFSGMTVQSEFRSRWAVFVGILAAITGGGLVFWAIATRGGISLPFAGLALVRADGRKAARWQCGVRAIVIWGPPLALLCLSAATKAWLPHLLFLHNSLWFAAVLWLVGYGVIGIINPGRGPQDRLSGVWVVPR
jgi:hypothetical protein